MNKLLVSLALVVSSPVAVAQNCFNGDFGTKLGGSTYDQIFPIQSLGFAFPLGGNTYTDVHVTTHGFVTLSNAGVPAPPATSTLYNPTTANFMAGAPKIAAIYTDVVVPVGEVFLKSTGSQCTITWRNAECYFVLPEVLFTFQMTLYPSGMVRLTYGPGVTNNSTFGGSSDNGIVGITPAGGAALPPQVDLSIGGSSTNNTTYENWVTANTFDMANNTLLMIPTFPGYTYQTLGAPTNCAATADYGTGCDGLALTGIGLPSLGNSNFTLRTSNIPIVSPISFVGFGGTVINPGVPLVIIGMPGCFAYTDLNIGLLSSGPVVSGVSDFVLAIPASPSIVGTVLSSQALSLSVNILPFGFASSNGTSITVGNGF
jgi:hypothetical protein